MGRRDKKSKGPLLLLAAFVFVCLPLYVYGTVSSSAALVSRCTEVPYTWALAIFLLPISWPLAFVLMVASAVQMIRGRCGARCEEERM